MPTSAFKIVKPTSLTYAGTYASVGEFGRITFSAITSLSLDGVFTSDYSNYMISIRHLSSVAFPSLNVRWRLSGTDASGSNYSFQTLSADSATVGGSRTTSATSGALAYSSNAQRSGSNVFVFGPGLAQATVSRSVSGAGDGNAWIIDSMTLHGVATGYDGFTLFPSSGNLTGALAVYGCNQ